MNDSNRNGEGTLIVQVSTADRALPIADASVIVSKTDEEGETLVKIMRTDKSGRIEKLLLPAPPASNSQSPGKGDRYSQYNIRTDYPGYYATENLGVPIFEGQTSIQPIELIPLPEGVENGKTVTVIETEPGKLI